MTKTQAKQVALVAATSFLNVGSAMASNDAAKAKGYLAELLKKNGVISNTLTFLLLFYAFYLWFQWGHDLEPKNALKSAWLPALVTFFALKWRVVLGWFGVL